MGRESQSPRHNRGVGRGLLSGEIMFALLGSLAILTLPVPIRSDVRTQLIDNSTSYEWIERVVSRYLLEETIKDSSPVQLLLHPEADSRVIERVVKTCAETNPSVLRGDQQHVFMADCQAFECFKVARILAVYRDICDVMPDEWKRGYGKSWNSRSQIAIWITRVVTSNESSQFRVVFEEILESFWSINCINVVIVAMVKRDGNRGVIEPRLFGYDPFATTTKNAGRRGVMVERGQLIERPANPDEPLFPEKLSNLNGFSIPVSFYQQEPHVTLINYTHLGHGTSIDFTRYFSDWLNFTVDLRTAPILASSYKVFLSDGSTVGPIGDVIKNRSEYLGNTEYFVSSIGKNLEFTRPFDRICVQVIVPRSRPMSGIIRTFRNIDASIAALLALTFILLTGYFFARGKHDPIMRTFNLLIHQQLAHIEATLSDRLFSITSIFWAFVVCTAFQSNLIKNLTDPPFYKNILSLEDLASSPLTLMIDRINLKSLNDSESLTKKRLAASALVEEDTVRCMAKLTAHGNVSCVIDNIYIEDAVEKLNRGSVTRTRQNFLAANEGNSALDDTVPVHVIRECLTEFWRTIAVKNGSPYFEKINVAKDRTIESGLTNKWQRESLRKYLFQKSVSLSSGDRYKLNISHFEGIFMILFIGFGIASVVFLTEIIFYHLNRRFVGRASTRRA